VRDQESAEKEKTERQAEAEANKWSNCYYNPSSLIGLSRDVLRDTCGGWDKANADYSAAGTREQLIYGRSVHDLTMYVYMTNGVVTSTSSQRF